MSWCLLGIPGLWWLIVMWFAWIAVQLRLSAFCFNLLCRFFAAAQSGSGDSESGTAPIYTVSAPKMCQLDILQPESNQSHNEMYMMYDSTHWRDLKAWKKFKDTFFWFNPGAELQVLSSFTHLETFRESKTLQGLRPTLSLRRIHWSFLSSNFQCSSSWWVSETFSRTRHATNYYQSCWKVLSFLAPQPLPQPCRQQFR